MPEPSAAPPDDASLPRNGAGPVRTSPPRIRREALDPDAVDVVRRLQRAGFEAYLVGGCVRDLLLGLEPKDFDVATSATPNQVKRLFRRAFVIGRRFRLVHVRYGPDKVVETATFRRAPDESAGEASDGPIVSDNVFGTAREDAFRRDFTVNALFYDPTADEVVDHVDGLTDLEARVVRSIGDPHVRLREDPVRMIRAVHFAARIGGTVEPSLLEAISDCAGEIAKASPSRLYVELVKVLTRGAARATLRTLHDRGVLHPWLPEWAAFLDRPVEWPERTGGTHEEAALGEPDDVPAVHLTWNLLGAADAWGMGPRGVPESLALAVMTGPWIEDTFAHGPRRGPTLPAHAEETLRPLALKMSVPRRATYELREILWLQDRLREAPRVPKRLRRVVLHPTFPEAVAYYGLTLAARDRDDAPVRRWHAIADEVWAGEDRHGRAHEEPPPEDDAWPADDAPPEARGPSRDDREAPRDERPARDRAPEPRAPRAPPPARTSVEPVAPPAARVDAEPPPFGAGLRA